MEKAKSSVVGESFDVLSDLFADDIVWAHDIHYHILEICDAALHNYQFRRIETSGKIQKIKGTTIIERVDSDEYSEMYGEIVKVISKYQKKITKKDAGELLKSGDIEPRRFVKFGSGYLPNRVVVALNRAGIFTQEDLLNTPNDSLKELRQIGASAMASIETFKHNIKKEEQDAAKA